MRTSLPILDRISKKSNPPSPNGCIETSYSLLKGYQIVGGTGWLTGNGFSPPSTTVGWSSTISHVGVFDVSKAAVAA